MNRKITIRLDIVGEKAGEPEDTAIETIYSEIEIKQTEVMNRTAISLWTNITHSNVCLIGASKGSCSGEEKIL